MCKYFIGEYNLGSRTERWGAMQGKKVSIKNVFSCWLLLRGTRCSSLCQGPEEPHEMCLKAVCPKKVPTHCLPSPTDQRFAQGGIEFPSWSGCKCLSKSILPKPTFSAEEACRESERKEAGSEASADRCICWKLTWSCGSGWNQVGPRDSAMGHRGIRCIRYPPGSRVGPGCALGSHISFKAVLRIK